MFVCFHGIGMEKCCKHYESALRKRKHEVPHGKWGKWNRAYLETQVVPLDTCLPAWESRRAMNQLLQNALNVIRDDVHENARAHGLHDLIESDGQFITRSLLLMNTETSELFE